MSFTSKLSPEQWAEARRMRAGGAHYHEIARRLEVSESTIRSRAGKEGWARPSTAEGAPAAAAEPRARRLPLGLSKRLRSASPATASIRSRLALRLYHVIECKIKMMELRMIKELQAHEQADSDGDCQPPPIADEREAFAALIDSINQVTEMASEPATAPDGRRRSTAGTLGHAINPELTALSADIDPDGLAVASEKDRFRRDIAEHLARMFPKP